ncbi:hypothetical protein K450DRAFT_226590 [Umbelopsis ramanniana AG]|uniref:Trehalase n=1 Tax=Umbelopsis ramanniana AG TaxID=1314678 RepID=A0AAD5HH14_UMBRA|nr:uncharacterized protein K450DRAFT_226590 [Umbelopsis ramanniana AG]KAI8582719.1 hypothetical protein K450DRAFT_226590 [Umbelopsis ramanniana AG]
MWLTPSLKPVLWTSLVILSASNAIAESSSSSDSNMPLTCDSPIYCSGDLLKTVQLAEIYSDSKTFVDMPTKNPLDQVVSAFNAIGANASHDAIQKFVTDNFWEAGKELQPVTLQVTENPKVLDKIDDTTLKGWASDLNHYWANLTFEFNTTFLCDGCVSSTLPVARRFVVPGGRFREFYYWDSYFVIVGLLVSELPEVAKDMIDNFLDFVDQYGFLPNGARMYYLNRSQPPFLTQMVKVYYESTKDEELLSRAIPILDKEYQFWQANTTVEVKDPKTGQSYNLNHYNVENNSPRPESYYEDYQTVQNGTGYNQTQIESLYADLATGAETGWDYCARWTRNKEPASDDPNSYKILRTLNTRNVIPVDLNSLLWSMESNLAEWHAGQKAKRDDKMSGNLSQWYQRKAKERLEAMEAVMWNEEHTSFYDFNLSSSTQNVDFTPAGYYPFWLGAVPEDLAKNYTVLSHVFDEGNKTLNEYPGILTSSLHNTTLQWDLPNGWPPLNYIAMQAMINVDKLIQKTKKKEDSVDLLGLAKELATRFVSSAFCGWYVTGGSVPGVLAQLPNQTDTGHMFEKFNVENIGVAGSGGEYTVQAGFGWTNGVTFWAFDTFEGFVAPNCTTTSS